MDDMNVVIKDLRRKDYAKAIDFAIQGMNFKRYTEDPTELRLYGKYFFNMELQRATQTLAAYTGDRLVGILMADVHGEPKIGCPFFKKMFVNIIDFFMKISGTKDISLYDKANIEMFEQFNMTETTSGEICFLASDPEVHGKGIGTLLLDELAKREKGKRFHLYTDDNCTYQFYEHRGFRRYGEKVIEMVINGKKIPLTCFLFSKVM